MDRQFLYLLQWPILLYILEISLPSNLISIDNLDFHLPVSLFRHHLMYTLSSSFHFSFHYLFHRSRYFAKNCKQWFSLFSTTSTRIIKKNWKYHNLQKRDFPLMSYLLQIVTVLDTNIVPLAKYLDPPDLLIVPIVIVVYLDLIIIVIG